MKTLERAILTYTGFTEGPHRRKDTEDLYFGRVRTYASARCTTYPPAPWTADVRETADQLARQHIREIAIIAYSHGSAAALDLTRAAHLLGIHTGLLLLCDGVGRADWLPRRTIFQPFTFRSLTPHHSIRIPPSVSRVASVRQSIDIPRAHDIIAEDPTRTTIRPAIPVALPHRSIDGSLTWFSLVTEELDLWSSLPTSP